MVKPNHKSYVKIPRDYLTLSGNRALRLVRVGAERVTKKTFDEFGRSQDKCLVVHGSYGRFSRSERNWTRNMRQECFRKRLMAFKCFKGNEGRQSATVWRKEDYSAINERKSEKMEMTMTLFYNVCS